MQASNCPGLGARGRQSQLREANTVTHPFYWYTHIILKQLCTFLVAFCTKWRKSILCLANETVQNKPLHKCHKLSQKVAIEHVIHYIIILCSSRSAHVVKLVISVTWSCSGKRHELNGFIWFYQITIFYLFAVCLCDWWTAWSIKTGFLFSLIHTDVFISVCLEKKHRKF